MTLWSGSACLRDRWRRSTQVAPGRSPRRTRRLPAPHRVATPHQVTIQDVRPDPGAIHENVPDARSRVRLPGFRLDHLRPVAGDGRHQPDVDDLYRLVVLAMAVPPLVRHVEGLGQGGRSVARDSELVGLALVPEVCQPIEVRVGCEPSQVLTGALGERFPGGGQPGRVEGSDLAEQRTDVVAAYVGDRQPEGG